MSARVCIGIAAFFLALTAYAQDKASMSSMLPEGEGKQRVEQYCGKCHELKRIEESQGTQAEWTTRIRRMERRGAVIPPGQIEFLSTYLAKVLPPRVRQPAVGSSPITMAVSDVAMRPIQTWIRAAGNLSADMTSVSINLNSDDGAIVREGNRVRAFALRSRSSMVQARVTKIVQVGEKKRLTIQLARPASMSGETYLVEIIAEHAPQLSVPNEALIEEGNRQVVYVQSPSGDYVQREVTTAVQGELYTQVVTGLTVGEKVVTFGSFFIDAEFKLKAGSPSPVSTAEYAIEYRGEPNPPREGENRVAVIVKREDGAAVTDGEVILTYSMAAMPSMNMPEMRDTFTLKHQANGTYRGDVRLSMAGTWSVNVAFARDGQKVDAKEFTIIVK